MSYATCRGCGNAFKKDGYGAQSPIYPKLCRDCAARETGHHPHHAPDVACLQEHMTTRSAPRDYAMDPRD